MCFLCRDFLSADCKQTVSGNWKIVKESGNSKVELKIENTVEREEGEGEEEHSQPRHHQ